LDVFLPKKLFNLNCSLKTKLPKEEAEALRAQINARKQRLQEKLEKVGKKKYSEIWLSRRFRKSYK
jgi:hypothetical protein